MTFASSHYYLPEYFLRRLHCLNYSVKRRIISCNVKKRDTYSVCLTLLFCLCGQIMIESYSR